MWNPWCMFSGFFGWIESSKEIFCKIFLCKILSLLINCMYPSWLKSKQQQKDPKLRCGANFSWCLFRSFFPQTKQLWENILANLFFQNRNVKLWADFNCFEHCYLSSINKIINNVIMFFNAIVQLTWPSEGQPIWSLTILI